MRRFALAFVLLPFLAGCQMDSRQQVLASTNTQAAQRAISTRAFDTADRVKVFQAVIATLQDLGFVVDRADDVLGTVSATRYGGSLVLSGVITVGTFTAFFMYVNMVVQPFRVAGFIVNLFQRAAVASDRLFEVFDLAPEIDDRPTGDTPAQISGAIEFRHLSFAYDAKREPALNDVSPGSFHVHHATQPKYLS